ncbi:MAG TPA: hypothetical protein VMV69_28250 [Pirellulales bacterium]|nr:hypothetical protein [Pirellulales bacterium]
MSSQNSPDPGRGIVVQKPKADIYTALLGIALVAVLLAIICLWLELSRYQYNYKATGAAAVGYVPPSRRHLAGASLTLCHQPPLRRA